MQVKRILKIGLALVLTLMLIRSCGVRAPTAHAQADENFPEALAETVADMMTTAQDYLNDATDSVKACLDNFASVGYIITGDTRYPDYRAYYVLYVTNITPGTNYDTYTCSSSYSLYWNTDNPTPTIAGQNVRVYNNYISITGTGYYYDKSSYSRYVEYCSFPRGFYTNTGTSSSYTEPVLLDEHYNMPGLIGRHSAPSSYNYGQRIQQIKDDALPEPEPVVTSTAISGDGSCSVQVDVYVDVNVQVPTESIAVDPTPPVTWYTTPVDDYQAQPPNMAGPSAGVFSFMYYLMERMHLVGFLTICSFIGIVAIFFKGKGGN